MGEGNHHWDARDDHVPILEEPFYLPTLRDPPVGVLSCIEREIAGREFDLALLDPFHLDTRECD